jgi:hypothetical protein
VHRLYSLFPWLIPSHLHVSTEQSTKGQTLTLKCFNDPQVVLNDLCPVNTLKLGKLFHIKNKTKLMKLCKFIRVIQYHSSPPWLTTYLSVIQIKRCYFISIIIIIQFCRPSFLTFETDQFLFFFFFSDVRFSYLAPVIICSRKYARQ